MTRRDGVTMGGKDKGRLSPLDARLTPSFPVRLPKQSHSLLDTNYGAPLVMMLEEAAQSAVLTVRQGGEWQFHALAIYASLQLGSKIRYQFHGTGIDSITILKQPPRIIDDGLALYKGGLKLAFRYLNIPRSERLQIIYDALITSNVLAEIGARFDEVGTIFVTHALAGALKSAKAGPLYQALRANAMLAMLWIFNNAHPGLFCDFLLDILLPVVYCVYHRFTPGAGRYRSPITPVSPVLLPANLQLRVSGDLICDIPLSTYGPAGVTLRAPLPTNRTPVAPYDTGRKYVKGERNAMSQAVSFPNNILVKWKRPRMEEQGREITEKRMKTYIANVEAKGQGQRSARARGRAAESDKENFALVSVT